MSAERRIEITLGDLATLTALRSIWNEMLARDEVGHPLGEMQSAIHSVAVDLHASTTARLVFENDFASCEEAAEHANWYMNAVIALEDRFRKLASAATVTEVRTMMAEAVAKLGMECDEGRPN